MSNKILIYTSNPDRTPRSMADVVKFAEEKPKYRLANVELSGITALRNAKAGDCLFTKKGNTIYILRAFDKRLEELSAEDKAYVDSLNRKGMKEVGIGPVKAITRFEEWCRSTTAKEVINAVSGVKVNDRSTSKEDKGMNKKSFKETLLAKIKSQYLPTKVDGARLTFNGEVAVINPKGDGYITVSTNGELTEYPEIMVLEGLPVYAIARPIADIAAGDVIEKDGKFYRVVGKTGTKLTTISYNGTGRTVHSIKDAVLGTSNVNVVVSLFGSNVNGINPLMLAYIMGGDGDGEFDLKNFIMAQCLAGGAAAGGVAPSLLNNPAMFLMLADKKGGDIDPLMFLLMGNNGAAGAGVGGINPMLFALMSGKDGDKGGDLIETLALASALGGNTGFNLGGIFGAPAAVAASAAAPAAPKRSRKAKAEAAVAEAAAE
jgi:hypothetical protein